jgi:PAS domain S-box-containing protein
VHLSEELAHLLEERFESAGALGIGNRQIQRIVRAMDDVPDSQPSLRPISYGELPVWNPLVPAKICDGPRRILLEAADAAADIILVADDERRYVDLNQAAVDALGLPREAISGRPIDDFFVEAKNQPIPLAWQQFIAHAEQYGVYKLRNREDVLFEYRAGANVVPGLHVSGLRPVVPCI